MTHSFTYVVTPPEDVAVAGVLSYPHRVSLPFDPGAQVLYVDGHAVTLAPYKAPKVERFAAPVEETPSNEVWAHTLGRVRFAAGVEEPHAMYGGAIPEPERAGSPERPIVPIELAVWDALMQQVGVRDDGRRNLRFSNRAGERLRADVRAIGAAPKPGDLDEAEFGQYRAAIKVAVARAVIGGLHDDIVADLIGGPVPDDLRLWAHASHDCDQVEGEEKAAEAAKARAEEQHRRNAAVLAAPNKRTQDERGVVEFHLSAGYHPPDYLKDRGHDYVKADGTRVYIMARTLGLRWPEESCPGWRTVQGDEVSDIPYSIASRPAPPRLSQLEFNTLVSRIPLDESPRPPWGSCSKATRRFFLDRLEEQGRALFMQTTFGYERSHFLECWVRGGVDRHDVVAGLIWKWMQKVNEPQAAHNLKFTGYEMPHSAIKFPELLADCARVAAAGRIPWGSLEVKMDLVASASAAWTALVDPLKRLFADRSEASSAEVLAATGLPDVPQSHVLITTAADAAGLKKARLSAGGERRYAFVPKSR